MADQEYRLISREEALGGATGRVVKRASAILYQLEGYDPVALGASMLVLVLVALGAGFVPAHRASRLEPMRALRYE